MLIRMLTIEGFKSIKKLQDFPLLHLNVLIGANGAGKSNFVTFFRLLHELVEKRLQRAIATEGGADACLYMGPKITQQFEAKLYFGDNGYDFALTPTADNRLIFAREATIFNSQFGLITQPLGSGQAEAMLRNLKDEPGKTGRHGVPYYVYNAISSWVVYHFHDTSATAGVRRQGALNDNQYLRQDASNLAAFLFRIRQTNPLNYQKIRDIVGLAAPFFDDFLLRPDPMNQELITLEWLQKESDYPFRASQLSDGTLRFICLATALLQPSAPSTMLFDEPELGLHPYALTLLASLFQQAAKWHQVIVSTQSAPLLNEFAPEDVIIVERSNGQSIFRRLQSAELSEWLQEYALGELWQKNVLGGRPQREDTPVATIVGGSESKGS